jgi:hypothetical protein
MTLLQVLSLNFVRERFTNRFLVAGAVVDSQSPDRPLPGHDGPAGKRGLRDVTRDDRDDGDDEEEASRHSEGGLTWRHRSRSTSSFYSKLPLLTFFFNFFLKLLAFRVPC